jgi:hypothetical protein
MLDAFSDRYVLEIVVLAVIYGRLCFLAGRYSNPKGQKMTLR